MAFQHPDKSRTLAPLLGALAIAAVALVGIFTVSVKNGSGSSSSAQATKVAADKALDCPTTYTQTKGDTNGWVPTGPQGLNGDDFLVPHETPTNVVVCAYLDGAEPGTSKKVPLSGRSLLGGSLAGLVSTLSNEPRAASSAATACTAVLTKADTHDYLFGLRYGSDTLWVSAPGYHCAGATNGSFTTHANLAGDAAASYAAKAWTKG